MAYSTDDIHFQRLSETVDDNYRRQKADRDVHHLITRYLMGEYYPVKEGDRGPQTAINLLNMAARAMSRHQVSKAPRVIATTAVKSMQSWAENQEIATNKRIKRSNVAATLAEVVRQSHVSLGVCFMAPEYVGTKDGMKLDLVIEAIDRADYGYDMESKTLWGADLQFDKFRMKLIDVREHPLFDEECRMQVESCGQTDGPDDETTNFRRAFGKRGLYDYVEIWRAFDQPRQKMIYFPRHQPQMRLAEFDWLGPKQGPYLYLGYDYPVNHAVPISPLMQWLTTHKAFNVLAMKGIHQQQAAKGVLKYTNAGKADAERLVKAVVNQSVLQENGAVDYVHIGGAAPDTVAMAEKQKRDFSYATGGIIDQFQQQGDTLGQERLLRGASNELLEDLGSTTYQFMRTLCENIYWFDVRDPNPEPQTLYKSIPGTKDFYEVKWTREHREFVREMDFEIDVVPYSYVEQSPQSMLADLLGGLQIVMGMMDQAVAQGITLDVEGIVRNIAKLKNMPILYDCLILNQEPERLAQLLGPRGQAQTGGNPAKPNGNYTRKSESDGAGESVELLRMFSGNSQRQEMKSVA